jgi:putative oxygen-independent coproporphyrinogen III oxidase
MNARPPGVDRTGVRNEERVMKARPPGLYVHVPYCASKCLYCDFHSVTDLDTIHGWFDAVAVEAGLYRGRFAPFGTLYIGGGTPSLLEPRDFERLAGMLLQTFGFKKGFEFTVEANPDDIERGRLDLYRSIGVNRLSIGVQSFDDRALRLIGRRHDASRAVRAVEAARKAGFDNISIDLIYALPGQTLKSWRGTLERALRFDPEHISCYELVLDRDTPLARMIRDGSVNEESVETKRDLFLSTHEILSSRDYIHYEVSNYSAGAEYVSRHNSRYWDHTPYLGLGPSAHSFSSGERWWNMDDLDQYCRMLEGGEAPVVGRETLSENQLMLERLYFGFRTSDGFPLELFDSLPSGRETLAELERTSLVRIEEGRAVPTLLGFLLSDSLPLLFSAD